MFNFYEETFFSDIQQTALGQSGENERAKSGGNGPRFQFQRIRRLLGVLLRCSWLCVVCIKCMEQLPFYSPAETGVVRRFPTSANIFVSASAGTYNVYDDGVKSVILSRRRK